MSIINEALKKASQVPEKKEDWFKTVLEPFQTNAKDNKNQAVFKHSRKRVFGKKKFVFTFLIFILVCGSAAGYYFRDKINFGVSLNLEPSGKETGVSAQTSFVLEQTSLVLSDLKSQKQDSSFNASELEEQNFEKRQTIPEVSKKIPKIELTGIMMENPPQALINGRFLKVGAKFRGVKVVKIVSDSVTFEYQGRKFRKLLN